MKFDKKVDEKRSSVNNIDTSASVHVAYTVLNKRIKWYFVAYAIHGSGRH